MSILARIQKLMTERRAQMLPCDVLVLGPASMAELIRELPSNELWDLVRSPARFRLYGMLLDNTDVPDGLFIEENSLDVLKGLTDDERRKVTAYAKDLIRRRPA